MSVEESSMPSVCAVVVAYRDDVQYLQVMVERLETLGVHEVLIVDNNPDRTGFATAFAHPAVQVLPQGGNLGSAGGFKVGLQAAQQSQAEFVWLLDEDNYPDKEALQHLIDHWQQLSVETSLLMLLSYRPHLFRFLHPYRQHGKVCITPRPNSFLGFHYRKLPSIIKNRLAPGIRPISRKFRQAKPVAVNAGYYGGLFLAKELISQLEMPREEMFLYWDDIEFVYRFVHKQGGQVYVIPQSRIKDLDYFDIHPIKRNFLHHPVLDMAPKEKAFYYLRNLIWFGRQQSVVRRLPYLVNKTLMLMIIASLALIRLKPGRLRLLLHAMEKAKTGFPNEV